MICNMESIYQAARRMGQDGMDLAHSAWIKVAKRAEPGRDYTGLVIAAMATIRIDAHRRDRRMGEEVEAADRSASRPDLALEVREVMARDPVVAQALAAGLNHREIGLLLDVSTPTARRRCLALRRA